ncbi:hypothetical protein [uncultured Friedmanniella sp.]|uniref:hypothetical protein n=1 Tax=uncultured Friedmanniella sp. TaxID=335381 RepID=UPI0035CA86AA
MPPAASAGWSWRNRWPGVTWSAPWSAVRREPSSFRRRRLLTAFVVTDREGSDHQSAQAHDGNLCSEGLVPGSSRR